MKVGDRKAMSTSSADILLVVTQDVITCITNLWKEQIQQIFDHSNLEIEKLLGSCSKLLIFNQFSIFLLVKIIK